MIEQTVRIQQIVMDTNPKMFRDEVNRLLLDGWRVAPGTFSVQSTESAARPTTPSEFITLRGTAFTRTWFVALELEETRAG